MTAAALEGPVTTGRLSPPANPRKIDLDGLGYVEDEWFASGTAAAYAPHGELGSDGRWTVTTDGSAPYRTRLVVRRPRDPGRFTGTVLVEWLNVSAVEAAPDWAYLDDVIVDAGAAWVGVSVQAFGIVGGHGLVDTGRAEQAALSGGIRNSNPERYASLEHPGDRFAFDIYAQVGAALRSADASPLFGASASTVVAVGESQSAAFLTTFLNAVHPRTRAYDGCFVHSRGASAARLDGDANIRRDEAFRIRDDLDVPVFVFETETDVGPFLRYAAARQPDTSMLRVWEVAGTAHADAHLVGRDFAMCSGRVNDGPQHWVAKAALDALLRWIGGGPAPARAEPIAVDADGRTVVRDDLGLAVGGVRTPSVDVPLSVLSGDAAPGSELYCQLFGSSTPFDPATLASLYESRDDYLARVDAALDATVAAGFVRAADRDAYAAEARDRATEISFW